MGQVDWGAIASGGSGLLGSIISAISGNIATNKTNRSNEQQVAATNQANIDIANQNNAMQERLNEYNNQFAHNEAELAYQRELEKMKMEWQYNSPIEQMKRYREAGINPSVAFSGNISNSQSANVSAPMATPHGSGVSPSMPSLIPFQMQSPFNIASGIMDGLVKSSQIIKALAEAKKSGAEADEVHNLAMSQIKEAAARERSVEISNMIQAIYGPQREKSNIQNLSAQAILAASEGNLNEAKGLGVRVEAELNRMSIGLKGQELETRKIQNKFLAKQLMADIDKTYSEAAQNRASAENQRAQAEEARAQAEYTRDALKTSEKVREKFAEEVQTEVERRLNIKLDNDQKKQLSSLIHKQLWIDVQQQEQDYYNPFRYVGSLLGGSGGAAIRAITK